MHVVLVNQEAEGVTALRAPVEGQVWRSIFVLKDAEGGIRVGAVMCLWWWWKVDRFVSEEARV